VKRVVGGVPVRQGRCLDAVRKLGRDEQGCRSDRETTPPASCPCRVRPALVTLSCLRLPLHFSVERLIPTCLPSALRSSFSQHRRRRCRPFCPQQRPVTVPRLHLELTAMYITSDLFGGRSTHNRTDTTPSTFWNTMADAPHAAGLGKRKRHETVEEGPNTCEPRSIDDRNNETDSQIRYMHQQRLPPASRRSHIHNASLFDTNRTHSYCDYPTSSMYTSERRPVKQMKRLSPKASLVKSTSHLMDIEPALPTSLSKPESHQHPVTDLRPCHACKSAPRRRKDLENYLDCRRCDGRTCYICARQCFGGCGKAVCKKCIVEVGEEGDPWCLDCYARDINS
jgi:hypothetical protein